MQSYREDIKKTTKTIEIIETGPDLTPVFSSRKYAGGSMEQNISISPVRLEVEHLSVTYGPVMALQGVDLGLEGGQIVAVIGPNGAGKSSLLKAMLGMIPARGHVTIDGQPLTRVRRRVAYVPQRSDVRWDFPVTVEDVVMMGRYAHIGPVRFPSKADREIVKQALEQVGMQEFSRRQIGQLSGGQQQRVFVARALAQQGDIILLDEPLTGVDSTSQSVIMNLLVELRAAGKLIIMATHDLSAAREADNCCCINHRLIAFGPPQEIFQPAILAQTYGGQVLNIGSGGLTTLLIP